MPPACERLPFPTHAYTRPVQSNFLPGNNTMPSIVAGGIKHWLTRKEPFRLSSVRVWRDLGVWTGRRVWETFAARASWPPSLLAAFLQ